MSKGLSEIETAHAELKAEASDFSKIFNGNSGSDFEDQAMLTVELWLAAFEDEKREDKPTVKKILPALSEMRPFDYELIRKKVAKLAGIRADALDQEVGKSRPSPGEEKQAVTFEDPLPFKDSVNGDELLHEIVSWINKYLVMDKGATEAVAAWCLASWCLDALYFAPILAILSATKRSGKSTLLDLVKLIVYRGFLTMGAGITPAILFRTNEKYHPTFLIDEAEKLSGDEGAKELIGLLNAGHKKGGTVFRCDPNTFEPVPYDAFGFRSVAAIGTLWDTILDRSIVIRMTRKTKEADVSRFSAREVEKEGNALASKIARWLKDNRAAISEAEEKTPRPEWLDDRACDNWTPLFAVGMVAENGWLDRLLESAKSLQPSSGENEGRGEMLIRDIKAIFEATGNPFAIQSGQIVDALNLIETSPWGDYRKGKGISAQWLAKNLKPFDVRPGHFRNEKDDIKGYKLEWFTDVFNRYLPPSGQKQGSNRHNGHKPNKNNGLCGNSNRHKNKSSDSNRHGYLPLKTISSEGVTVSDG